VTSPLMFAASLSGDDEKDALALLSKQHETQQRLKDAEAQALQQRLAAEQKQKAQAEAALKRTEEEQMCVICLDKARAVTFVPCGHLCCCEACGGDSGSGLVSCPVCRKPITARQRVFKS
jgi:hypothetical protein